MDKKRVLFIMQLPPPVHGASIMNQSVLESQVLNERFECRSLPLNFENKIEGIGKISFRKILKVITFLPSLIQELRSFQPDLVYYTLAPVGFALFRDAFFVFIIKCFGFKIVFHLHGKGIKRQKSRIKKLLYTLVFKNTSVIHLGETLVTDLEGVHNGPVFILPNGVKEIKVDMKHFLHHRKNSVIRLVYLSNLIESKGVKIFLNSLMILKNEDLPFEAVIIGNSSKTFTIEDATSFVQNNNLTDHVKVLGPLFGDSKVEILLQSDLFVFPTYFDNECFPLAILEAMQFGLAIITTDNGAIPEIVENGTHGLIVEQRNTAEVVNAIKYLINDRQLVSLMGSNSLLKYKENYTLDKFEHNLSAILEDILGN